MVREKLVSSRKGVLVLEAKTRRRRVPKSASMVGVTAPPLLRAASTEQMRQILRALTAVHTYAVNE